MKATEVSVRDLRTSLGALLQSVATGNQVIITRRGKRIARLIPEPVGTSNTEARYPLRGSVLFMADDFDATTEGLWDTLRVADRPSGRSGKRARPRGKRHRST